MNAIAGFRKCTLSDNELLQKVDTLTDKMFIDNKVPTRNIPALPNDDYDLLIGEMLLRFNGKWIDATVIQPELIERENYYKNVWAVCNGELSIMCYCYIPGDDGGFTWANCNGNIEGDAEFDDDYEVTHWMPFPSLPVQNK